MYDTRESRTIFYKLILRRTRKHISIILIVGILLSLTGCSFLGKNQNDPQGFSPIRLEKLEDTVDTVVEDYFYDKYGVEVDVTYKNIAGNVFLGPDPSSVQYYLVTVNIEEEGVETEYYLEVHGREVNGQDELYVKKEAYYGKVIKERMEEWLDKYVDSTNIDEHYLTFFSPTTNLFSSEYDIDLSAEDIIKSVSSIENIKERPSLHLYLLIPESEYKKHDSIENEFSELRNYLVEHNSKAEISVLVCENDVYEKQKNGDDSRINPIAEYEITGNK